MAKVAAKRLTLLVHQCGDQEVSHQHIAVYSGYCDDDEDVYHDEHAKPNCDLLKILEDTDLMIISKNDDKIASAIRSTLERTALPPESKGVGALESPADVL